MDRLELAQALEAEAERRSARAAGITATAAGMTKTGELRVRRALEARSYQLARGAATMRETARYLRSDSGD